MEKPLPKNVVQISSHRSYRNRKVIQQQVRTSPPQPPSPVPAKSTPTDPIVLLFKAISDRLVDLHHEGLDQRNILRALVANVCDLKAHVDSLRKALHGHQDHSS